MGGTVFLPHQLFSLRLPSIGAYRLLGGARSWCQGPKMSASSWSSYRFPLCLPPDFMTPERATATPDSLGDHPRPASMSGTGSYGVTAFALVSTVHENLCAPSKSGVSVSPSPVELLQSSSAGLQSQMLWGLLLLMSDP